MTTSPTPAVAPGRVRRVAGAIASPLLARGLTLLFNNSVGQGLAFLTSLAVARLLGVTGFGEYAAIMALVFVLGMVAEGGLEASLTREIARDPTRSRVLLLASLRAKAVLGGVLAVALALPPVARLLAPSPSAVSTVRLAGLLLALNVANSSISAVFRAWGRMHYIVLVNLTGLAVQLVGAVAVLLLAATLSALIAWLIVVQVGELLGGALLFRRGERDLALGSGVPSVSATGLVRRSLPFALAGVLAALQLRVDLLLIEALRGTSEVAVFSVAARLQGLLMLAPTSFFAALFPALAAAHGEGGNSGGHLLYARALRRMALAGSVATVVGVVFAHALVLFVFGHPYAGAELPMRLLALQAVPLLLNTTTTLHLYASAREGLAVRVAALNVALRLAIGCALVPAWGAAGAAVADVIAETASLAVYGLMGVMRTTVQEPVLGEVAW